MKSKRTIETEVAAALNQDPFEVKIGNRIVMFNRLSLSDREKISAYSSVLPKFDDPEGRKDILYDAIEAGRYSKILARIISIASKPKSDWRFFNNLHIRYQKRKVYKAMMSEPMSTYDLYDIYKKIAMQIGPAFFLDIFISLKGANHLKPTKETDQTAPGH